MAIDITSDLDPSKLSLKKKMELVKQTDGLLIELLENKKIRGYLNLHGCTGLAHLRGKEIKGVKGEIRWQSLQLNSGQPKNAVI